MEISKKRYVLFFRNLYNHILKIRNVVLFSNQ